MLARRLLLVAAVLLGLTLVVTALAPPPSPSPTPTNTAPSGGAEAPADAELEAVEVTLDTNDGQRDVEVAEGDIVRLVVTSDEPDSIELRGFGLVRHVARDTPAEFEVYADEAGEYPLILLGPETTIGTLRVTAP